VLVHRHHREQLCQFLGKTTSIVTIKFFYLPTDAQENCFVKNIKIYIKTAPTCFGAIIIIIIIIIVIIIIRERII